jgi:HSP20 family protein
MSTTLTTREPRSVRPWFRRRPFNVWGNEPRDLIAQLFGDEVEGWLTNALTPSLDLSETETAVEARMDLPGMKAEDFEIRINENVLTVTGERKEEKEEKGRTFHRMERRTGLFSRSIPLPCAVNAEKVDARYHDGVLTISMPKTQEAKAHKIAVKG